MQKVEKRVICNINKPKGGAMSPWPWPWPKKSTYKNENRKGKELTKKTNPIN